MALFLLYKVHALVSFSFSFFFQALPVEFQAPGMVGTTGAAVRQRLYPKCYARVKEDGIFSTVVTRINPEHRQGEVLHPQVNNSISPRKARILLNLITLFSQQRRVLTVREYARAQGFSDKTDFHSTRGTEQDVSIISVVSYCYI